MNYLDLFSGCGGFRRGLEEAGFTFEWEGHSEIDKYANQVYEKHYPKSEDLGDVRTIRTDGLPKIDLITFGFPCQDLSIAGKRGGLKASRSGLFFEAMRIVRDAKPDYFIFENVKGLFSSRGGLDWLNVLREVADSGYDGQWQLLNTRWFLPQNRERIYFVGYPRGRSRPQVFPIGEEPKRVDEGSTDSTVARAFTAGGHSGGKHSGMSLLSVGDTGRNSQSYRVYSPDGIATTLAGEAGGLGAKTGLYRVTGNNKESQHLESCDVASSLKASNQDNPRSGGTTLVQKRRALGPDSGLYQINPDKSSGGKQPYQQDRVYDKKGQSPALNAQLSDMYKTKVQSGIRRLTPLECERLQGFPDGWTEGQSDTQRYKMMGNAVSVPVVKTVGEKLI